VLVMVSGGGWMVSYSLWGLCIAAALSDDAHVVLLDYRAWPFASVPDMVHDVNGGLSSALGHIACAVGCSLEQLEVVLAGQSAGAHLIVTAALLEVQRRLRSRVTGSAPSVPQGEHPPPSPQWLFTAPRSPIRRLVAISGLYDVCGPASIAPFQQKAGISARRAHCIFDHRPREFSPQHLLEAIGALQGIPPAPESLTHHAGLPTETDGCDWCGRGQRSAAANAANRPGGSSLRRRFAQATSSWRAAFATSPHPRHASSTLIAGGDDCVELHQSLVLPQHLRAASSGPPRARCTGVASTDGHGASLDAELHFPAISLVHGTDDTTAPHEETLRLRAALLRFLGPLCPAGRPLRLATTLYTGCSHTDPVLEGPAAGNGTLFDELRRRLRASSATRSLETCETGGDGADSVHGMPSQASMATTSGAVETRRAGAASSCPHAVATLIDSRRPWRDAEVDGAAAASDELEAAPVGGAGAMPLPPIMQVTGPRLSCTVTRRNVHSELEPEIRVVPFWPSTASQGAVAAASPRPVAARFACLTAGVMTAVLHPATSASAAVQKLHTVIRTQCAFLARRVNPF